MRGLGTRRTTAIVGAVALLAIGAGVAGWWRTGPRLRSAGFGLGQARVRVGEERTLFVELETGGGTVTLRSATPHPTSRLGHVVEVRVLDEPGFVGTSTTEPLDGLAEPGAGTRVGAVPATGRNVRLAVRMVLDQPGTFTIDGIDVAYDAGWGRRRSTRQEVCLSVSTEDEAPASSTLCPR